MVLRLGYDVIATDHLATGRLTPQDRCRLQPLSSEAILAGPGGEQALLVRKALPWAASPAQDLKQLKRLTLSTDDPAAAAQAFAGGASSRAETAGYDLLAVQPLSERLLQQACSSLQVDIVSLDMSHRLPFKLRPKVLAPAVDRGVMFEISYACCLRDDTSRRMLFSNATALARATRGQNVILSSGARTAFELRSPYDVINLATLFGLPERHAKTAISTRCEQLLAAASLRSFHKGVIKIEEVGPAVNLPKLEGSMHKDAASSSSPSCSALGKRKSGDTPQQLQSSKRKKKGKSKKKGQHK
ncbi:hypothetical protein WJX74_006544 [Apatococcus lobatus]|uniref:Uncharacterized protein n=1 Tax=Apatococcus lobatus TaxID=904363 RepID=A0AAW1RQ02_9CHLO